ncbi:MAG TPA: 50S ribosomal protein L21 [Candidatus Limnocylindria bacterium]|nr:50S ribosomal protein L21 [Candidatus Limnocylindria bacterium]
MYAVVDNGGKQYRVEAGETLVIDRLDAEAGASVTFDRVLLIGDEDGVTVGTPTVAGASVHGTVVAHGRGPKIIVFRFRPKAHYRRRTGHRSELTQVRIDEIATASGRSKAASAEKTAPTEKKSAPRRKAAAKPAAKAEGAKAAAKQKAKPAAKPRSEPATKAAAAATED